MEVTTPEISAAAAQGPEQFLLGFRARENNAAIRKNNFRAKHVVERKSEAADQRPIATAQGHSGHANHTGRARHCNKAQGISDSSNVRSPRATGYLHRQIGVGDYAVHIAEIDDDSIAQRTAGPVVASPTHRQSNATIARGPNCRLNVSR
jgi:hypothetical protein